MNTSIEQAEQGRGWMSLLTNGIIKENPVLVLLLGACPSLAVTTSAINGLGMGIATMLVLLCSNIFISLLKNIIPSRVRIPSFIVIIAGFVTIVGLLVQAYAPEINEALGIFLPLIVVNCVVLGRAEMFATRNPVLQSTLDGLGMGLGFTLALFVIGGARELLGNGSLFGIDLTLGFIEPMGIFLMPPGGFFIYGILIAIVNKVMSLRNRQPKQEMGCESCPSSGSCGMSCGSIEESDEIKREGKVE
jgi:electron transport complex protein RnfE